MPQGPVKRDIQIVTQDYYKEHGGIDLRSTLEKDYSLQMCVLTERATLIRRGIDGYGNDFVVFKPENPVFDEVRYIHVNVLPAFNRGHLGEVFDEGTEIGKTQIFAEVGRGNSKAHHLHFAVVQNTVLINPLRYLDHYNISWEYYTVA